jgi:hypothetical protein
MFQTKRFIIGIILGSALLGFLPYGLLMLKLHHLPKVPPEFVDDSLFYFSRMKEIKDGQPFIGNPYLIEHRNELAPGFFVADWIAALPLFVGFSLLATIMFNAILWTAASAWLVVLLCRELRLNNRFSGLIVGLFFLMSLWLVERPVSMQIVFSAFFFFLIAMIRWFREPQKPKNFLLAAVALACCFYVYTYLWQIAVVMLFFIHCGIFYLRDKKYLTIFWIDSIGIILALPLIVYTIHQIKHPYYWQSMVRSGLVYTHTFGSYGLYLLGLFALAGIGFWIFYKKTAAWALLVSSGLGLVGAAFSNVITGKDLETAVHIGRFVEAWFAICFGFFVFVFFHEKIKEQKKWAISLFVIMALVIAYNGFTTLTLFARVNNYDRQAEAYVPVLNWLEANSPTPVVVASNKSLSTYVPLLTNDYVLNHQGALLYLLSDRELEDRYLLSQYGSTVTVQSIERDYRSFSGVGNALHEYKTHNRDVALCTIFHGNNPTGCGEKEDIVSHKGLAFFQGLLDRYQKQIAPQAPALYEIYHVHFVVRDQLQDPAIPQPLMVHLHKVYNDNRFVVYEFK